MPASPCRSIHQSRRGPNVMQQARPVALPAASMGSWRDGKRHGIGPTCIGASDIADEKFLMGTRKRKGVEEWVARRKSTLSPIHAVMESAPSRQNDPFSKWHEEAIGFWGHSLTLGERMEVPDQLPVSQNDKRQAPPPCPSGSKLPPSCPPLSRAISENWRGFSSVRYLTVLVNPSGAVAHAETQSPQRKPPDLPGQGGQSGPGGARNKLV